MLADNPNYYQEMGKLGGQAGSGPEYRKGGSRASGFAAHPERARELGAVGGAKSKRGPAKKKAA